MDVNVGNQTLVELKRNPFFKDVLAQTVMNKLQVARSQVKVSIAEKRDRRLWEHAHTRRLAGAVIVAHFHIFVISARAPYMTALVNKLDAAAVQSTLEAKMTSNGFNSIADSIFVSAISQATNTNEERSAKEVFGNSSKTT